jgi:hypothetical protein
LYLYKSEKYENSKNKYFYKYERMSEKKRSTFATWKKMGKQKKYFPKSTAFCGTPESPGCLMRALRKTLPRLLPMDLSAFLAVPASASFPLLFVLAQVWEPEAVKGILSRLRGNLRPSPAALKAAITETLKHLSVEVSGNTAQGQLINARAEVLSENGCIRLLGPATFAQRLQLIVKNPNGKLALGIGGERYDVNLEDKPSLSSSKGARPSPSSTPLQSMARIITTPNFAVSERLSDDAVIAILATLDGQLQSLPGWALMGPNAGYVRPHVLRKFALWLRHHHGQSEAVTISRANWLKISPDENQHLSSIPPSWSMARIQKLAPSIPLLHFSMWCCLLGPALRIPGAREWFAAQDVEVMCRAWDAAASDLQSRRPELTPSAAQVTRHAMKLYPSSKLSD